MTDHTVLQPGLSNPFTAAGLALLNGGASIALSTTKTGPDVLSESEGQSVNLGASNVLTPRGFITRGGADTLSESITQLTVV